MEDLIELVAASFARHGVECPLPVRVGTDAFVRPAERSEVPGPTVPLAESTLTAVLPDHNYRNGLQGDPAP